MGRKRSGITRIEGDNELHRVTGAAVFEAGKVRNVVVTVRAYEIGVRLAKTRVTYWTPIEAVYHRAVKDAVIARQKERKAKR